MRGWLTWLTAFAGACYSPRPIGNCDVICGAAEDDRCPDGFTCGASGLCSVGGHACAGDTSEGFCFGSGIAKPCVPTVPLGSLMLTGDLNTDTDGRCISVDQPVQGPKLCVLAGERIVVTGPVHATGSRPLVLVANETITVSAMLDARSVRTETVPGAGASSCASPFGLSEGGIGAGGAGGSFQGSGGAGGSASSVPGTAAAAATAFPDHVRGGCPGGGGGEGTGSTLSEPGAGGGALYLIANKKIDVQAVIAANGAGALEALPDIGARLGAGGGGGGSGGLIVLEAPVITFGSATRLLAMGGAGAGGGASMELSKAGGDPDPAAAAPVSIVAVGGPGGRPDGGAGGNGSSLASPDGAAGIDGTTAGGGGGGGGGSGFIKLICTTCPDDSFVVIPPALR